MRVIHRDKFKDIFVTDLTDRRWTRILGCIYMGVSNPISERVLTFLPTIERKSGHG